MIGYVSVRCTCNGHYSKVCPRCSPRYQGAATDFPLSCFRGLFGQYRNLWAEHEGADAFDFASLATAISIMLGRRVSTFYARALYPNLFTALVGPTGIARKSTAAKRAIYDVLSEVDSEVHVLARLSSSEGLIQALGDSPDANPEPRRVAIYCDELAGLLRKTHSDKASTLQTTLAELYDCPPRLQVPTRINPIVAPSPTTALLGCTTAEWFEGALQDADIQGGFANRFCYVTGDLRPAAPMTPRPNPTAWQGFIARLRDAVRDCPNASLDLDPSAEALWIDFYGEWTERPRYSESISATTERIPNLALKVALIFAAIEGRNVINEGCLMAGIEFALYTANCTERIFGTFMLGDQRAKTEAKILHLVTDNRPISLRDLHHRLGGRTTGEDLRRMVSGLVDVGRLRFIEVPGARTPRIDLEEPEATANVGSVDRADVNAEEAPS